MTIKELYEQNIKETFNIKTLMCWADAEYGKYYYGKMIYPTNSSKLTYGKVYRIKIVMNHESWFPICSLINDEGNEREIVLERLERAVEGTINIKDY